MRYRYVLFLALILTSAGCKMLFGPDKTGEFRLSSEKFLADSYYLFGYSYEDSEFYRYPFEKDPHPDIINEGTRVLDGQETIELSSFNTPGQANGFALVGELSNLNDARDFYNEYNTVEEGLQFSVEGDIVEAYQVWVQLTSAGNYVKLLVKEVNSLEGEEGNKYSEAHLDYTYQPNGSKDFTN
jgi:hypothetical protein